MESSILLNRLKFLPKLEKSDIVLFQETLHSQIEHNELNRMVFKSVFSSAHTSCCRRGVALITSSWINFEPFLEIKGKKGRFVLIRVQTGHYLTSMPHLDVIWLFFKKIFNIMGSETQSTPVCGGDWKVHLNPKLDLQTLYPSDTINCKKSTLFSARSRYYWCMEGLFLTNRSWTYYSYPHAT